LEEKKEARKMSQNIQKIEIESFAPETRYHLVDTYTYREGRCTTCDFPVAILARSYVRHGEKFEADRVRTACGCTAEMNDPYAKHNDGVDAVQRIAKEKQEA
jgi:hypothetical protein